MKHNAIAVFTWLDDGASFHATFHIEYDSKTDPEPGAWQAAVAELENQDIGADEIREYLAYDKTLIIPDDGNVADMVIWEAFQ